MRNFKWHTIRNRSHTDCESAAYPVGLHIPFSFMCNVYVAFELITSALNYIPVFCYKIFIILEGLHLLVDNCMLQCRYGQLAGRSV